MTCSSNTICMAEPCRRARRAAWLALMAALVTVPFAGHAEPQVQTPTALVEAARAALRRGDGIDAEMKLRAALSRGVPRDQIAAFMGGAFIRQDDRRHAREWLGPGVFSPATAAEGFRVLAQLEQLDNNLPAAARAYDRVLAIAPDDASLWVEIGRLRYRAGQHVLAIQAADHAMALDPRSVRALEFRGELVRDRFGLLASLPWFERALVHAPGDASVLSQYAATLGELGRASDMLVVTRRLLQFAPGNPQAYYLQAVLAARAGRYDVARQLLARTRGKLDEVPGAILLEAVLELSAGNTQTASELCEQLLEREPDNMHARQLLARALYNAGQYRYLTLRFRDDIARNDASPYLLTMVARGFEATGNRVEAGKLLDRAAVPVAAALRVVPVGSRVGALMAQGRSEDALATAERDRAAEPGSYETQAAAGDVQLALGHPAEAQQCYAMAARVRMSDSLLQRRFQAFAGLRDAKGAAQMVGAYLQQNPGNRTALRLQATLAVRSGDPLRAGAILDYLRRTGSEQDVQLLTDLALVRLGSGDVEAGEQAAAQAYRLQRGSPIAAQALALSYATLQVRRGQAISLLDKARQMLGDNPLLAQARARLGGDQQG
jgi:tetratricopeptide (TPR) repeat protein